MTDDEIRELVKMADSTPFSDMDNITSSDEYNIVIKLGERALPFILIRGLNVWSKALSEITKCELNLDLLSSKEKRDYWKKWKNENGY